MRHGVGVHHSSPTRIGCSNSDRRTSPLSAPFSPQSAVPLSDQVGLESKAGGAALGRQVGPWLLAGARGWAEGPSAFKPFRPFQVCNPDGLGAARRVASAGRYAEEVPAAAPSPVRSVPWGMPQVVRGPSEWPTTRCKRLERPEWVRRLGRASQLQQEKGRWHGKGGGTARHQ